MDKRGPGSESQLYVVIIESGEQNYAKSEREILPTWALNWKHPPRIVMGKQDLTYSHSKYRAALKWAIHLIWAIRQMY